MAGQSLRIDLDPGDRQRLEQYMAKVAKGVASLDPFFDAVEMHMIQSLTANFEAGGRPTAWAPLSPVTIELKGSDRILQDEGKLKQSVNASNTERSGLSLTIWAGEKHGVFHQDADMDPLSQFGVKNKRGMPFRPFILFQPDDPDKIQKLLENFIDDVMS